MDLLPIEVGLKDNMALTKAQQTELNHLRNAHQRDCRRYSALAKKYGIVERMVEILCDRLNLSDEQQDEVRRQSIED